MVLENVQFHLEVNPQNVAVTSATLQCVVHLQWFLHVDFRELMLAFNVTSECVFFLDKSLAY